MRPAYDERKTTAVAALFLERAGGRLPYLKLLKLLYLADRRALDLYGSPITGDSYVSMKHGPVLSGTYDIIKATHEEATPGQLGAFWRSHIGRRDFDVELLTPTPSVLSPADRDIAEQVHEEFGGLDTWQLAERTHLLPEWRNPGTGAVPIDCEDILVALGKSKAEADELLSRLRTKALVEDYARSH